MCGGRKEGGEEKRKKPERRGGGKESVEINGTCWIIHSKRGFRFVMQGLSSGVIEEELGTDGRNVL